MPPKERGYPVVFSILAELVKNNLSWFGGPVLRLSLHSGYTLSSGEILRDIKGDGDGHWVHIPVDLRPNTAEHSTHILVNSAPCWVRTIPLLCE